MADAIFGFPVISDDKDDGLDMYSKNRLSNGDAEIGSTAGWTGNLVSVTQGGIGASQYVFKIEKELGAMRQDLVMQGAQPPDYKFVGIFLPGDLMEDTATRAKVYGKVIVRYATGEPDEYILPVMEPMAYKPIGRFP